MRTMVVAFLLATVPTVAAAGPRSADRPTFQRSFVGTIGDRPATLHLDYGPLHVLWGRYAYTPVAPAARAPSTELLLEGELQPDGSFVLKPSDIRPDDIGSVADDGTIAVEGTFTGRIVGDPADPAASVHVAGTFSLSDDETSDFTFVDRTNEPVGSRSFSSRAVDRRRRHCTLVGRVPELVDAQGRRDTAFARAVDGYVTRRLMEHELQDVALEETFEISAANERLVSVRFEETATSVCGITSMAYLGLTYDRRRGVALRLEDELVAPVRARRFFADTVTALCRDTAWRYRYGRFRNGGGFDAWTADERGVVIFLVVEQSAGSVATVIVPWPFVRSWLRPTSALGSLSGPST